MALVRDGGGYVDPLINIRVGGKWQQRASMDTGLSRWAWAFFNESLKIVDADGKKALEYSNGSTGSLSHVTWSGNGPKRDLAVLARFRRVYTGTDNLAYGVGARFGGTQNARKGIIVRSVQGTLRLNRYNGAALAVAGAHPNYPNQVAFSNTPGTWLYIKLLTVGSEHLAKAWSEGSPEPADWLIGSMDANIPDAGSAGLFVGSGGTSGSSVATYQCSRFITAPL